MPKFGRAAPPFPWARGVGKAAAHSTRTMDNRQYWIQKKDKAAEQIRPPGMVIKTAMAGMAIFLVILICGPVRAFEQMAQIQDILISPQGDSLLVYGRVVDCFTKEMESAVMAGVPTTFTFLVDLYQERSGWTDKKITSTVVKNTIKYDSIRKIFSVFSSLDRDPAIYNDLESAKRAMAEFNGALAIWMRDIRKDLPHYVLLKAKLDKVRLPLHMEYVFFFVSLWDFETAWHRKPVTF